MEVKRQHINFIIILCFIWGCGGAGGGKFTFFAITWTPFIGSRQNLAVAISKYRDKIKDVKKSKKENRS